MVDVKIVAFPVQFLQTKRRPIAGGFHQQASLVSFDHPVAVGIDGLHQLEAATGVSQPPAQPAECQTRVLNRLVPRSLAVAVAVCRY